MKTLGTEQSGFAAPAMFVAVLVAFIGSLNVKGKDGTTVAEAMGREPAARSEFASIEYPQTPGRFWVDE